MVAEFAVVVVLQDVCSRGAGAFQQLQAAVERHGASGGELMGGGDVDELGDACGWRRHGDALEIQRHGLDVRAEPLKDSPGAQISGFLMPDRVAGMDQNRGGQVDGLLGAVGQQYLAGVAVQASRIAQVGGDGTAQGHVSACVAGIEQGRVSGSHRMAPHPLPQGHGNSAIEGWHGRRARGGDGSEIQRGSSHQDAGGRRRAEGVRGRAEGAGTRKKWSGTWLVTNVPDPRRDSR